MKTNKNLKLILFLFFGMSVYTTHVAAQDPNFHIYLAFGQSNMEGNARIQPQDTVAVDKRFQVLEAVDCENLKRSRNKWYTAVPPLSRCRTGLTPTDYFGRTMVENLPKNIRVGVVNVSVAGCKIEAFDKDNFQAYVDTSADWLKNIVKEYDGNPYARLVELGKLAQKDGVIKGILLHQGESNTGDAEWPRKVKAVYDNLIKDLNLKASEVPLLAGEVVNEDQGGRSASMNKIIATLPQTLPNSYVISSAGCTDGPDNLHFNSEGYQELGIRYAEKMLSLQGIKIVKPDYLSNSKPATTNVPNAQFPRITPDLKVIFRTLAPNAQKVVVNIGGKKYNMKKDREGYWMATSDPQVPGFHYYDLLIDDVSVSDPASETFYGVGRMYSAIEVPSAGEDFYTMKNVPHGDIRTKRYFSKTTNEWRTIYVYCPPGYDTDMKKKYPVLYIQHGGGEDQRGWAVQGKTDIIMDNLIAEGKAKPMIVVMETSAARKPGEPAPAPRPPAPAGGQRPRMNLSFDTFKEVMTTDLIPFIDTNFRTLTDSKNRAMSGLSMGGMVTTSVTLTNLDKFAYIGCFSGGPRITATDTLSKVYNGAFADAATFNKKVKLFFISNGTVEGNTPVEASDVLKKAGINNVVVYQSPGTAHEWLTWRRSLYQFAPLLFK